MRYHVRLWRNSVIIQFLLLLFTAGICLCLTFGVVLNDITRISLTQLETIEDNAQRRMSSLEKQLEGLSGFSGNELNGWLETLRGGMAGREAVMARNQLQEWLFLAGLTYILFSPVTKFCMRTTCEQYVGEMAETIGMNYSLLEYYVKKVYSSHCLGYVELYADAPMARELVCVRQQQMVAHLGEEQCHGLPGGGNGTGRHALFRARSAVVYGPSGKDVVLHKQGDSRDGLVSDGGLFRGDVFSPLIPYWPM